LAAGAPFVQRLRSTYKEGTDKIENTQFLSAAVMGTPTACSSAYAGRPGPTATASASGAPSGNCGPELIESCIIEWLGRCPDNGGARGRADGEGARPVRGRRSRCGRMRSGLSSH